MIASYCPQAIADVAEAIIGAAYISGGRETALNVTKALKIPIPNIEQWSDFGRKALAPPPKITAKLKPKSLEKVEAIIGHKIARPHLLAQALVSLFNVFACLLNVFRLSDPFVYTRLRVNFLRKARVYRRCCSRFQWVLRLLIYMVLTPFTVVIRHIFDRDQQLSPGGLTLLKVIIIALHAVS